MNTKKLSLVLVSVMLALVLCAFAACNKDGDDTYQAGEEVGSYYCVVNGAEAKLTLGEDGTASLVLGEETLSGPCQKDKDNPNRLTMTFGESSDLMAQATYGNNVMTVSFRSTEYRFLRDVEYTVTFNSNGGSAVNPAKVRNGKTLSKPADPKKGDLIFLGWYKDNDTFKQPYQFGAEAVTGNITLYACYGESAEGEFDVTYNPGYDGGEVKTAKTSNGVAEILTAPQREGYEFVGWFVSDYEDSAKLTYKYEGQTLYQNTVLYGVWEGRAPVVSITGNTISWNNLGRGSYSLCVYDAQGEVIVAQSLQGLSYEFDFSAQPAGEYSVGVKYQGYEGFAYLKNKALPKVSLFKVANGTALTFNSVANAAEYVISIDCGNKYHEHSALSNGLSTTYNFANCDMQKGGIKFTVTAKAEGYMSSVSDEFSFEQGLNAVTGLKATDDGRLIWNQVENAESYLVTVKAGETEQTLTVKTTEISIKEYGMGAITFAVQPLANNYYSPEASMCNYQKSTLASPKNITLNQTTLTWEGVQGATYKVKIGGKEYSTNTNSLELQESYFSGSDRTVSIQAVKGTSVSLYSDPVAVESSLTEDMVSYANGYVTWGNVFGAVSYRIEVNPGKNDVVDGSVHSYKLDFASSGEYTVKVSAFGSGVSGSVTLNLSVYSVHYESNGGTTVSTSYLAKGDYLTLPESAKGGYDFTGWYNAVGGASSNGKEYNDGEFTYSSDVTMYANWTPKPFKITVKWNDGDQQLTDTQTVYYKERFTLPVPQIDPNGYAFGGWYLGSIQYTDQNGRSLISYDRIEDITLEANFMEVLKFELLEGGKGYSVKKGDSINKVTQVTIPATYKDKPVLEIQSGAFASASYLRVVNIPDTVNNMFIPIEGFTETGSSFQDCSRIEALNIYETEVNSEDKGIYYSEDGVLYRYNRITNEPELYAYPKARTGNFVIADGVKSIRSNVFKGGKMNSVTVPSSVTKIDAEAFGKNSNLISVIFAPAKEGEEAQDIIIDDEAFYDCDNLLEVTLPARMQNFNKNMFSSCKNLSNVYFEEGAKYVSIDGVVTTKDEKGVNTLYWYPIGRDGDYTIPAGITKIDDFAFTTRFESSKSTADKPDYTYTGNVKIEKITIPGWVTYIGVDAFRGCYHITDIEFLGTRTDNALSIEKEAFYGLSDEAFTEVTLPENLVYLGESAFGGCSKLVTVNLNSIDCKDFQMAAFASTSSSYTVTTLNIGKDTGAIEIAGVFGTKLANVYVDPENQNYEVMDNVVYDKAVTSVLFYPVEKEGSYITPATITGIGANVFKGRKGLDKITIGKNVTFIGESAFENCSALTTVTFEQGGTADLVIGDKAFKSCNKLTAMHLPERTVEVGVELVAGCTMLKSASIPATLTNIKYSDGVFNMFTCTSKSALAVISVAEANTKYASKDGILYEKDADGNLVTLLYCPSGKTGTIDAPKTITKIADRAFSYSQADKLTFSEGIVGTTLVFGDRVFYKSSLTAIELPKGLTEIAEGMFYENAELVTVTIPDTVKTIGKNAFYGCVSLANVVISNSVETISDQAFYKCTSLQTITIPNSVKSIEKRAFSECTSLSEVIFEEGNNEKDAEGNYITPLRLEDAHIVSSSGGSHTSMTGYGVFYKTIVKELILPERTTYVGSYLMGYSYSSGSYSPTTRTVNKSLTKVVIPSTIEGLGKNTFYYCVALETVQFVGDGVSKLKDSSATTSSSGAALNNTFYGCDALKTIVNLPESSEEDGYSLDSTFSYSGVESVELPASVNAMKSAFNYCADLSSVTFRSGSKLKTIGTSFRQCHNLKVLSLPVGLETIEDQAFIEATGLTSIVIPETVKTIGQGTFEDCTSLTSVTFATYNEGENKGKCSLETIEYQAFKGTALTEFVFPVTIDGSLSLGTGTTSTTYMGRLFKNCGSLTTVTLSSSVTDIEYVLDDCPSIENVIIADDNEYFTTKEGQPYVYDKNGTGILFLYGAPLKGHLIIPEGITEIAPNVFKCQTGLTEVTIPYTVSKIGISAFDGCMYLTKVNFQDTADKPSALQTVGENAFANCINLAQVNLPETDAFTVIPKAMFMRSGLTSVTIPKTIKTISSSAFAICEKLTSVDLPLDGQLNLLDSSCFFMTGLKAVVIPSTVTQIKANAFQRNDALKTVTFARDAQGNTSIKTIMGSAFGGSEKDASKNIESIEIPKSVTTLTGNAFSYITGLKSVTFEKGTKLTSLESSLFKGTGLTSITIPASIITMKASVFEDCANLATVTFEEGSKLTVIGDKAFKGTAIESITIPALVKTIGSNPTSTSSSVGFSFEGCKNLKTVNFEEGSVLTGISKYSFRDCTLLTGLNFNNDCNLATIGEGAFDGCTSVTSIVIPDTVTDIKKAAFANCTALERVEFSEASSLKTLGDQVFMNCTSLTSIKLPNGTLTSIPSYAFYNCSSLVSIDIPDSVKKFNSYVFSGCTKLEKVNFGEASALTELGSYMFAYNKGSSSVPEAQACSLIKTFAVPDGVTKLGNYMFQNCTEFESITFGENSKLTCLGTYTFRYSGLKSIEVPAGVTILGTSATSCSTTSSVYTFADCENLTSVTFKGEITKIGGYAFFNTPNLVMDIPSTVTLIGKQAFENTGATTFTIPATLMAEKDNNGAIDVSKIFGYNPFANCKNLTSFTVAEGNTQFSVDPVTGALMSTTKTGEPQIMCYPAAAKGNNGVVTIPDGMGITIAQYAFMGCSDIKVELPSDMKTIPEYAFAESGITGVTIPVGVEEIDRYAFQKCAALTSVEIPESVTSIDMRAFDSTGLTSVTIPATVETLGNYIFSDCVDLTEVTIESRESIPTGMFCGCIALTSLTIPEGVTSIGDYALSESGITSVEAPANESGEAPANESVKLPSTLTTLGKYVFRDCTALTSVTIPESVTSIGDYCFSGTSIESIVIPSSVTTFGKWIFNDCLKLTTAEVKSAIVGPSMFRECTALKNVTLAEGLLAIHRQAFYKCTALEELVLPQSLTDIYYQAFAGSALKSIVIPAATKNFWYNSSNNDSLITSAYYKSEAFKDCLNLAEATLSEGLEMICGSLFEGCTALKKVNIPDTVTVIGNGAFKGCTALEELRISKNIVELYNEAFANCTGIKKFVMPVVPTGDVNKDIFAGWTSEQTLYFGFDGTATKAWEYRTASATANTYWYSNCKANIVWNYVEENQ